MKEFSNKYIFIFSSVMVIAVAILLSMAATLLQPRQEKNLEIEKKKSMLESINVSADPENAEVLYSKYIKESIVLNSKGETVPGIDAFTIVYAIENKKPLQDQYLPVFFATTDDGERIVILPVEGKGLWGPIFGYVSLKSDLSTVYGVTFDHKGETPGLGAEINTTEFENQFIGKKLFEADKFISVKVVKGGTDKSNLHGVDAISGGTITSNGLEKMLFDCISKYEGYILKNKK